MHEQWNPLGLTGERSRRAGKLLKKCAGLVIFFKKIISKTVARHNSEYVTLIKKEGKHAGLPKRVRSPHVLIHTCAGGGWRTQHAHRNCSFLFRSGSFFFFNASSSSQGGLSAHFAQCSYAPGKGEDTLGEKLRKKETSHSRTRTCKGSAKNKSHRW